MKYTENEIALIFLSQFDFMTSSKFEQFVEMFKEPKALFSLNKDRIEQLENLFKNNYEIVADALAKFNSQTFFSALEKRNIFCLTILSSEYPQKLKNLKNPPYVLYCAGDISLLNSRCVAIVGTRSPTNYGKLVTEKFSKTLAEHNITIVSGLASGVDKIAHECALDMKGKTIAVMGGGFDHIFPAMNVSLAREIFKNGLVITEYFTTCKPTKYSFPHRNRIIAALSSAIIITEADFKSGSLYTKEFADELGIDTYAIPGNINSEKSNATNNMIKNGSAICATDPKDILKDFGICVDKKEKINLKCEQLSIEEQVICNLLKDQECTFEFLQEKTGYSTQTLNYNLTTMEIRGIIKKLAGNSYILN